MGKVYTQIIRKLILLPVIFLVFHFQAQAQVPTTQDCLGAIAVCQSTYWELNSYSGTGNYPSEINPTGGTCLLDGEINDVWYTFTVITSGQLSFVIQPNNNSDDYDWALFNLTNASCSDIYNNLGIQVCCNYSGTSGATGMYNPANATCNAGRYDEPISPTTGVVAGETYVLNISNPFGTASGYNLNFSASTASIYDITPPTFLSVNTAAIYCGATQLSFNFSENVLCSTIATCDFRLTGPGGPYTITNISGAGCAGGISEENTFTITYSPPITQSGTYNIALVTTCGSVTDLCGNVAPANDFDFSVTAPGASISPASPSVCPSGCVTLTASGGTNFTWSDGLGTNPVVSVCPSTPTTYYVTATSESCTSTASVTVNIYPVPTVTVPANIVVCNNDNLPATNFTSTPSGGTYAWTNDNTAIGLAASGTGDVPAFTATNTGSTPITATITVSPTVNGCPGTPSSYTITVNPTPTVVVPSSFTVCNGALVPGTVFASIPAGGTYSWTVSNTAIGLPANGTGNVPSFTATNPGSTPITATITVISTVDGCPGTPSSYTITVNPTPTVVVPANFSVCNGATVPASAFASVPAGGTFTWTNSNIAIGLGASGTGDVPSFIATNPGLSPISGTITVTPTANGCTGTPSTYTITVNPTVTVNVPASYSVCNGATVPGSSFSSPSTGVLFTWTNDNTSIGLGANGNGSVPSFIATNTGTTPITATITVTPSINTCPGNPSTYTITVYPTTTVVVPANFAVCNGVTIPATAFNSPTPGAIFAWTNNNTAIGLGSSGTGDVPSFTATNTGTTTISATITVTPSINTCPGTPSTYTITVNPTVSVVVPANIVVCNGATVPATAFTSPTTGTTFTWTNSNTDIGLAAGGNGNVPSFTATNTGTLPITATITVTPSANNCTGTTSSYTITVNPTAMVVVPYNIVVCNGENIPATAFSSPTPGTTYTWTNSNTSIGLAASGNGDVPAFTATNTGASPITATITVTPSANSCTGTPSTYTITVNPTATVILPANIVICNGATVPATAFTSPTQGTTYTWTNSDTSIGLAASGIGNVPSFTATNNGTAPITATITVTPTANYCTGTASSYTITVNPTPAVVVPADIVICHGGTIPATSFTGPVSGTTYTWTNSNTAIGLAASGTGDVPAFTATNPGINPISATITVTPSANNCTGTPSSYQITVNPIQTSSFTATTPVCGLGSSTVSYTGTATQGATFSWNFDGGTATPAGGIETYTVHWSTPGIYNITLSVTMYGCTSSVTTQTVAVSNISLNAITTANVSCFGLSDGEATVTAINGLGDYLYLWNSSPPQSTQNAGNLPAGTYIVTVTDSVGCTLTDTVVITQPNLLTASAEWSEQVSCHNVSDATISVFAQGGTLPYTYALNGGTPQSSNLFSNLPGGSYTVLVTDAHGCTTLVQEIFIINPDSITATFLYYSNANCFGTTGGSVEVVPAGGTPYYNYLWSNGATSAKIDELASEVFTVTVTDTRECTGVFSIEVLRDPKVDLDIPNAFSPNGDGKNDKWILKNLELYPENELVIINRWGNEVYSVNGYLNDWDGSNLNEGTYFYVLKVNMCYDMTTLKGYITVLR